MAQVLRQLRVPPLQLKEHVRRQVTEAVLGQRRELLTRLVALGMEVMAALQVRLALTLVLPSLQLIVHIRGQLCKLLLVQARQLLTCIRTRRRQERRAHGLRAEELQEAHIVDAR